MSNLEEIKLQAIYDEIVKSIGSAKGQCVLLLGPELSVNKDGVYYKNFFKNFVEEENKENKLDLKYFENENIFNFSDDIIIQSLISKKVEDFYSNVGNPELLELISRIKFPLIINACPDLSLYKVIKNNCACELGFFLANDSLKDDIPIPTKEHPVIYNIFGRIGEHNSLILYHGDLYNTIEKLLQRNSLPDNIELYIKDIASSFIFLGFKFDSWHYQLLCHRLNIKDNKKKVLCTPNCNSKNNGFIMENHFKMIFTCENPILSIKKLYELCKEKDIGDCDGSQYLRPVRRLDKYCVYISYAGKDDDSDEINRETIIELLEKDFQQQNNDLIHIIRDKNDLDFGDSINNFMGCIGKGKTIIRVISDKYLKSVYCMDEALRIHDNPSAEKRIYTILLNDVEICDEDNCVYKKYWKEKYEDINKKIDENIQDVISREEFKRKYDIYLKIYHFVENFIIQIKDEVHLKIDLSDINDDTVYKIKKFVNTIIKEVKED